jgi:hypothetical protein
MSRAISKIISKLGLASVLLVTAFTVCCPKVPSTGGGDGDGGSGQNVTAPVSATLNC